MSVKNVGLIKCLCVNNPFPFYEKKTICSSALFFCKSVHRAYRKVLDLPISDLHDVAMNLFLADHSMHKNISIMFLEI